MTQDLEKTLWAAADKLRNNMDAAEYKHIVLGLVFLKYISDAFSERRAELELEFSNPKNENFKKEEKARKIALDERDYYTMANVFWVPENAKSKNSITKYKLQRPTNGKRLSSTSNLCLR